jgi:cell division protein FtsB
MNVPVEMFDAFRVVNTDALAPEKKAELEDNKLEAVVALGLATMASDPTAWSIEILPASVRKKREFMGGQLFLIAAAALALVYLGYSAWSTRSAMVETREQANLLESQYKKASGIHRRTEELVAENKKLAQFAEQLAQLEGMGEQVARGIVLLQDNLPQEFWVNQLSADWRADPALGSKGNDKRPVLSIGGKAREGQNSLSTSYARFVQELGQKLPAQARYNEKLSPNGARFTLDLTQFPPPPERTAAPADGGSR